LEIEFHGQMHCTASDRWHEKLALSNDMLTLMHQKQLIKRYKKILPDHAPRKQLSGTLHTQ